MHALQDWSNGSEVMYMHMQSWQPFLFQFHWTNCDMLGSHHSVITDPLGIVQKVQRFSENDHRFPFVRIVEIFDLFSFV